MARLATKATDPGAGWIGRSVPRREDKRLLLGDGTFVADVTLPNIAHASFARSPHPHAMIKSIDLTAALAAPGVVAAFSGPDLREILPTIGGMQVVTPQEHVGTSLWSHDLATIL